MNTPVYPELASLFTPNDIQIATRMGALNQLNSGITTLGDWCHNNPTPAHTDAGEKIVVVKYSFDDVKELAESNVGIASETQSVLKDATCIEELMDTSAFRGKEVDR